MSLEENIEKWFSEEGYPLEMLVASLLRESDFRVTQSSFFVDPETKKSREIDVVANYSEYISDFDYYFSIDFIIECKYSVEKPWILMKYPREQHGDEVFDSASWRICDKAGFYYLLDLAARQEIFNVPFFKFNEEMGYGLTQAFTNKVDVPYKAVMSCLKAAIARKIKREENVWAHNGLISIPVVILEGKLFEAKLNNSGSIEINEVGKGTLLWKDEIADQGQSIVHIITKEKLKEFINEAIKSAKFLIKDFKTQLPEIDDEIQAYIRDELTS